MKPLIIYHANCADGFGAAFAAWLKLDDTAEYLPIQYGEVKDNLDFEHLLERINFEGYPSELYILDFSFPRQVMDTLFTHAGKVVWLDHHKTAFEMYGLEPNKKDRWEIDELNLGLDPTKCIVKLDNNKSGALLAWGYFHPDKEVPLLIRHIDDYDRWQFKIEGTKEFNKALWSYAPWNFEQWNGMFDFPAINDPYRHFLNEGAAILRAHKQNVQAVVSGAVMKVNITAEWDDSDRHTFSGLAANCPPHLASDVGHELANQSGTFGLLWHINKEGKCLCSVRSNGYYDVSAIAKAFGGGGHKNAAGFEVPIQTLLEWL